VTAALGAIRSPNWPSRYPSRKECEWSIGTAPGHRVQLTFSELDVEPHADCSYDHVAVHDGPDAAAPLIGRFCGSVAPPAVLSSGSSMFVRFVSDGSVQKKGFEAAHSSGMGLGSASPGMVAPHGHPVTPSPRPPNTLQP
ncbi:bone morphogenetic protein 1-like, partial [Lagopus leucura]|uniref:bone morphogenetic protein 1-like n=1 Tax=Lagopus leucura TaxID=30410 RepID=UPI001C67C283